MSIHRRALLVGLALAAAGCVHYPMVMDVGGTRIHPANGRVVRQGDGAVFYVNLESTGKFGDVLTSVTTPAAREAHLVSAGGGALPRLVVPGVTTVALRPGGEHVVLSGLTRALAPGETVIVTLVFEKTGKLGVVSVVE